MYWNGYCLYALICFLSPARELSSGEGMCSYYTSEDVGKKSLVIDISKQKSDSMSPGACVQSRQLHTILIYAPDTLTGYQQIIFSFHQIDYEHLIVLNNALPVKFAPNFGEGPMKATSLTVHKNDNILTWSWLKVTKFKYIRIDDCTLIKLENERLDELILSEYLLTLTLVKIKIINPLYAMRYELAPNLRELSISHFEFTHLVAKGFGLNLRKLKRLNLSNNKIEQITPEFFNNMPQLEVLILEGNRLKALNFHPPLKLNRLFLDDNPLQGNRELCRFLKFDPIVHFSETSLICADKIRTET